MRRSSLFDPLVRPRIIVELPIFVEHVLQVPFAPDDQMVEAFVA